MPRRSVGVVGFEPTISGVAHPGVLAAFKASAAVFIVWTLDGQKRVTRVAWPWSVSEVDAVMHFTSASGAEFPPISLEAVIKAEPD